MDSIQNTHTPEVVQGYKILESTVFVNDRGFALAENPDAPQPFVTWQFTETDSGRDYYWGHYKIDADNARQDFYSRVREYQADYGFSEKPPPAGYPNEHGLFAQLDAVSPIAAVEMSTKQNPNQNNGVRNNMAVHQGREKPSVVSRIQEVRITSTPPKEPHAPKKAVRGDER